MVVGNREETWVFTYVLIKTTMESGLKKQREMATTVPATLTNFWSPENISKKSSWIATETIWALIPSVHQMRKQMRNPENIRNRGVVDQMLITYNILEYSSMYLNYLSYSRWYRFSNGGDDEKLAHHIKQPLNKSIFIILFKRPDLQNNQPHYLGKRILTSLWDFRKMELRKEEEKFFNKKILRKL